MTEDPAANQRLAARVAGASDLKDVRLLGSRTNLEMLSTGDNLTYSVELSHKVEHEPNDKFFAVRIEFAVKIEDADVDPPDVSEDDENPNLVAEIWCELAALYAMDRLKDQEAEPEATAFQAYAETAATLSLFPYAREFVSTMTSRLGLPTLTLPVHTLPSPWHPSAALAAAVSDEPEQEP